MFKKTVKAGENTAALRWFWWEGDALMVEAQETADTTETCTAACDIQMPGSEQERKAKLTQLAQGLTLREYVYYPYSFEPLALITHRTGPDGGCGDKDPTAVYFYHNDVNGAPMRLTDRTGAVVWRQAESGAWSTRYRQEGLVSNPLRFQGQYFDEESGLHYNRYRYYEPESGRYISADPLKLGAGLNLYQYAPDPLGWIDPLGLINEFGIAGYGDSAHAKDGLTAHELLQNAWLRNNGAVTSRTSGIAKTNPSIALQENVMHKNISSLQAKYGLHKPSTLKGQTALRNINMNTAILRRGMLDDLVKNRGWEPENARKFATERALKLRNEAIAFAKKNGLMPCS
ncbi:hypothetical protein FZU01_22715 [Salmonella enterica subsp. enterica]|nr:hypothetical protein [Salmonella enterica subsp. enterica serovar Kintambo]